MSLRIIRIRKMDIEVISEKRKRKIKILIFNVLCDCEKKLKNIVYKVYFKLLYIFDW